MNPVLVELPHEVLNIEALPESTSVAGWHHPVILTLDSSFVVVNGESGQHLRTYEMPVGRSKIVDIKFLQSENVFVVATDDSHLVLVAEASKSGSDCFQQKWPVQIESLQVIGAKQLVVVSKNASEVAVVVVEGDRIAVPNYAANGKSKKTVDEKIVVSNGSTVLSVGKASTSSDVQLQVWETSVPATETAVLLSVSNSSHQHILSGVSDHDAILSVLSEENRSIHLLVQPQGNGNGKKSSKNGAKEGGARWLKYDFGGNLLFERSLGFTVAFARLSHDHLWVRSSDATNTDVLQCWSARYGTLVQENIITAPRATLTTLLALDVENANYSLIYGLANLDGRATTLFRYDVGGAIVGKVSLATTIGMSSQNKRKHSTVASSSSSAASLPKQRVQEVQQKYYEILREEALDEEKTMEYFAQDKKKRRKISQTQLPFTAAEIETLLLRFPTEKEETCVLTESDWTDIAILVRLGVFPVQRYRHTVFHTALSTMRLDVLVEMMRFAADLTEFQVVDILEAVLRMAPEEAAKFAVLGCNVVAVETKEHVVSGLSAESLALLSQSSLNGESHLENGDNKEKKSSKKKDKKENGNGHHSHSNDERHQLVLLRAVTEALLYRIARFSPSLASEALQRLPSRSVVLLLRTLIQALFDICTTPRRVGSSSVLPYFGTEQVHAAVEWIEAALDSHFSTFVFEAQGSAHLKSALQGLVQLCQNAENAIDCLETLRGLWTDIERSLTRQGVTSRVDPGLYIVETLRL